jgi:hypothetical protein
MIGCRPLWRAHKNSHDWGSWGGGGKGLLSPGCPGFNLCAVSGLCRGSHPLPWAVPGIESLAPLSGGLCRVAIPYESRIESREQAAWGAQRRAGRVTHRSLESPAPALARTSRQKKAEAAGEQAAGNRQHASRRGGEEARRRRRGGTEDAPGKNATPFLFFSSRPPLPGKPSLIGCK